MMTKIILLVALVAVVIAVTIWSYKRAGKTKGKNELARILGKPRLHP